MRNYLLSSVLLFISLNIQSQSNEWLVGLSGSFVKFDASNLTNSELYNFQFPRLNLSRCISPEFSLDAAITFSTFEPKGIKNEFDYFSFDMNVIYNFNLSDKKLVPYLGIGGTIVGATKTIQYLKPMLGLNIVSGGTLWLSSNWGLNSQIGYKFTPRNKEILNKHFQLPAGIVYSFSSSFNRRGCRM